MRVSIPIQQLFRYGLIGVSNNVLLYLGYLILTRNGLGTKTAMSIAYLLGICISFIGNKNWTFDHYGDYKRSTLRYAGIQASGYFFNFLILSLFVDRLGFPHEWVQLVAIFVIAGYLFIAFKYYVFKKNNP